MEKLNILLDLDNTVCANKQNDESYEDVKPLPGAVEQIQRWKKEGHTISIYTARHMKTCNNDIGEIIVKQSRLILNWLDKYNIPIDKLYFGKPNADVIIDDKAIRAENWKQIKNDVDKLLKTS